LGFKPRSTLKDYYNLKHSSFIYPDEAYIKGSTVAFTALLDRMLHLEKIAIVRLTSRTNSSPRLAALLPQRETFDEDGIQADPPGFHVIILPYAGDIRHKQERNPNPKASDEQILRAKKLVKTLRIKFSSSNFENPTLQIHYANLQALALDRETVEETNDLLQPDEEGMQTYSDTINNFKSSVLPDGYTPDPKKTPAAPKLSKKRPRETTENEDGKEPAAKRPKVTVRKPEDINWEQLVTDDELQKCKLPELKGFCKMAKIKGYSSLKKGELIELVKKHVKEET